MGDMDARGTLAYYNNFGDCLTTSIKSIQMRSRNRYDPASEKPYKLSRSRLERYIECPCCFYLDRRMGIDRIGSAAYTLNTATDTLLKKEFDVHRANGTPHPLMKKNNVDALPFRHDNIDTWRKNFEGVQFHHKPTNFLITGAVDDIWINAAGELIVVDYKSTSKDGEVTLDDNKWKEGYKRQMEIYQWLLRRNGFPVSNTGYFVYVNADTSLDGFDGKLVFDEQLLEYVGNDGWVEDTIVNAHTCLCADELPPCTEGCKWCEYREDYVASTKDSR